MRFPRPRLEPLVLYGGLSVCLFAAHLVMNKGAHLVPASDYIEAQAMRVLEKKGEFQLLTQSTKTFEGGTWVNDNQLIALTREPNQSATFLVPIRRSGVYRIHALLTRSFDYGIVRIEVNGRVARERIDLYCPTGVLPTGAVDLGNHTLSGNNTMRVTVVGRNASNLSPHYQWGMDGIRLTEVIE